MVRLALAADQAGPNQIASAMPLSHDEISAIRMTKVHRDLDSMPPQAVHTVLIAVCFHHHGRSSYVYGRRQAHFGAG